MRWSQLKKSCRVATEARAEYENEWLRERFGNDCVARRCCICAASLAAFDPYDLIELGTGLVCVECLQRPGVAEFRREGDPLVPVRVQ